MIQDIVNNIRAELNDKPSRVVLRGTRHARTDFYFALGVRHSEEKHPEDGTLHLTVQLQAELHDDSDKGPNAKLQAVDELMALVRRLPGTDPHTIQTDFTLSNSPAVIWNHEEVFSKAPGGDAKESVQPKSNHASSLK